LKYKDYQLVSRPAPAQREGQISEQQATLSGLHETDTVKDFGTQMEQRGVYAWWRTAMGYAGKEDRL